jgi:hypothetical protein
MYDFQGFRYPIAIQEKKASAAATNEDITIGPVPPGHLWVITNIALEDETTNFTSARISITGYGEDHHLIEDKSLLAATLYWYDGSVFIPEGRSLRVRFVGTTSADVLAAYINGFDVIQPEGAKHA